MASPTTSREHIESRPEVCGGKPCIAGTRIRVQDIYVWHELHGRTPAEIVQDFPQLTFADIHAALAYYFDHREEIVAEMQAADDRAARIQGAGLLERLNKLPDNDPLSS